MPKRKILGLSSPIFIGLLIVLVVILVLGLTIGPRVPQPHIELPAEVVFHIFGFPITNSVVATWLTIIILVVLSFIVTKRIKIVPGRLQAAFEFLLGWLYNFCGSAAGEKNGRRFFPIVTTIFLFVAFNAWLGLLPGYGSILVHTAEGEVHLIRPANTDFNTPLAIAVVAVMSVQYFGLRTLGRRYVSKFINIGGFLKSAGQILHGKVGTGLSGMFTGIIEIFVGLLELLSEFIHIVSFTLRLFGNMTAGEILILVAFFLIPWLMPIIFYGLELLIGFIQGLIFGGLTLIFLTLAVSSHDEHEA